MIIQYIHSSISVLFLLSAIAALLRSYWGWRRGWVWRSYDGHLALVVVLTMYLQMLLGLYLFFSAHYLQVGTPVDKPADLRFWPLEHFFIMLFALLTAQLAVIIVANTKRHEQKFRLLFTYFSVSFTLVIVSLAMIFSD